MDSTARKILLPQITITEVAKATDDGAELIILPDSVNTSNLAYFIKPMLVAANGTFRNGMYNLNRLQFNLFPVVLDSTGIPWAEAAIYILDVGDHGNTAISDQGHRHLLTSLH